MGKEDRLKASDLHRNADYVFVRKGSFEEAFPEIEDIKIKVESGTYGMGSRSSVSHYEKNVGEYVDCTNPMCYGGGFSVGEILRSMVAEKQTHIKEIKSCRGYEGSPKGRRRYRSCINSFEVTVDIVYKK